MNQAVIGTDVIGVGVGALIFNDEGKLLMAKRGPAARNERGKWEIPGGAIEFGETLEQGLKREIKEELNITIKVGELLQVFDHILKKERQHWVSPTYICRLVKGTPKIMEPTKCAEIGWFTLPEAEQLPLSIITKHDIKILKARQRSAGQHGYHRLKPIESSSRPIHPQVDIGHVHLKTADIDRVYDFYVGILGFGVVFKTSNALFLSAGGYHHDLGFNTWDSAGASPPPRYATGLYHVAIRYPDRPSLGDALLRLQAAGWPIDGVNDHGTHEALYLRDPDQNGLELYWDRPESDWPLDSKGHLQFGGGNFDLAGLVAAGKSVA
jgi:catechol 2,3-dioxygenase